MVDFPTPSIIGVWTTDGLLRFLHIQELARIDPPPVGNELSTGAIGGS